jgi:hypothetical protein
MASAAQIEVNRRNAQKIGRSRIEEGRFRSRFNFVKHGFRAEKAVIPGEDPAALQERLDDWTADLQLRNLVEQNLVDRGVRLSWQLDRVLRAQDARLPAQIIAAGVEETNLAEAREEAVFRQQVAARQLKAFMPKDAAEARGVLAEIVAHASSRLTALLELHLRRDNQIKALAADCRAFDDSPPGTGGNRRWSLPRRRPQRLRPTPPHQERRPQWIR